MGKFTLLSNQVIVKSENGIEWIYDVDDPEVFAFLESKGTRDENGNLVLSMPLLAVIRSSVPVNIEKKVNEFFKELQVPNIQIKIREKEDLILSDLQNCTNKQLEEMLSVYGGYKAFLEAQLANIEAKKGTLESVVEEGLAKMFAMLYENYDKKPLKEVLRGIAFSQNPELKNARKELIEVEAIYVKMRGLRDAYKSAYDTVSRIVALRISSREEV